MRSRIEEETELDIREIGIYLSVKTFDITPGNLTISESCYILTMVDMFKLIYTFWR
jgi:hypothetical protein